MDNKFLKGTAKFFKKEGFYVILFVCLCIVATVAVVTTRTAKGIKHKEPVAQSGASKSKDVSLSKSSGKNQDVEYEGALRVKKETNSQISVPNGGAKSVPTSTAPEITYGKPAEGTVSVPFSVDMITLNDGRSISNGGINIVVTSQNGEVLAAADGVVETVGSSDKKGYRDSDVVIINHQNGIKTKYYNIKAGTNVKNNMKVTKGTVIGNVIKTSDISNSSTFGSFLHFEVFKNNEVVDPQTYVKGYVPTPSK